MEIFMPAKHKTLCFITVYFLLFSFACSSSPKSITPSVSAPDIVVSDTPSPTSTLAPTATVQPSETPLPSATPASLAPDLGQVVFNESFDDLESAFNFWGPARIENGIVVLEREAGYKSPEGLWPFGGMNTKEPIPPDVTTIILFRAIGGATFNIGYHAGDYGTESLRRFSFNSGSGAWDLYKGNSNTTGNANFPVESWNARQPDFNTWHYFAMRRSSNGDMDVKLWERDKPETMFTFHGNLGPEWAELEVTFFLDYHQGSFMLDEYQELK